MSAREFYYEVRDYETRQSVLETSSRKRALDYSAELNSKGMNTYVLEQMYSREITE